MVTDGPMLGTAHRLLVVDDDRSVLASVAQLVRARLPEWDVDCHSDVQTALEAMDRTPYDVVVSDLRMPALDGLALLRAAGERLRYTPFIMLTAYGSRLLMFETLEAGAFTFLTKPIDADCLIASLRSAASVRTLHLELQDHARGLEHQISKRREAERALADAHAALERRVQERTSELAAANERLRAEIAERERVEKALRSALDEVKQKQDQLIQAAKLATVGELTTGMAHELNNPLNNIGLFIGNVMERLRMSRDASRDETLAQLQSALGQVHRAGDLIKHMLTFGRSSGSHREPLQLNDVVTAAYSFIDKEFKHDGITCRLEFAESLPPIIGNPTQLEQVVLNLLTNARDAVRRAPEKRIIVTTRVRSPHVELVVDDTGEGIPKESLARIFDPFFTTKEVGRGTGLGLSVTYGIVRSHHGHIVVKSEVGLGASFTIRLPFVHHDGSDDEAPASGAHPVRRDSGAPDLDTIHFDPNR